MSLLRRRMMMKKTQAPIAKYPLIDGIYPLYKNANYEIKNGEIYIPGGKEARFCLTTPSIPYNEGCVSNVSWLIQAGSVVLFEIDNTCGLTWQFRATNNLNVNLNNYIGKEFTLTSDVKNIFAIGGLTAEGIVTLKLYVNEERWI